MTTATSPPTIEDARAAAEVIAEAGATRVLLFGSVARDEAEEFSDVDLVAVFDDINYSNRYEIAQDLNKQIKSRVGVKNDVIVTDRPEWKARTEGDIPTCFEACVSVDAVPLIDNEPSESINWEKPMDLPVSRISEALSRVKDICSHWGIISLLVKNPRDDEVKAWEDYRDYQSYLVARDLRFRSVCGQAHLTIEACLKLLLALYCVEPPKNIRDHRTYELTEMLRNCSSEQADITEHLLGETSHTEISFWHVASNYDQVFGGRIFEANKNRTGALIHLAERMTSHSLAEYKKVADIKKSAPYFSSAQSTSKTTSQKVDLDGSGLDPEGLPGDHNPYMSSDTNDKKDVR